MKNEKSNGDPSFADTFNDNIYNEDAEYAEGVSNPTDLLYTVTSRLIADSSVNLEFAKDQYLSIIIIKDNGDDN